MNRDLIIALTKRGWLSFGYDTRMYKIEGDILRFIELNEDTKQLEIHGMTEEAAIEKGIVTQDFINSLKLF